MTVNYNDPRFAQVEAEEQAAKNELEQVYSGLIGESDQYYQAQIDASKEWADTQSQLQQEKTDFAIQQIEQQKGQAKQDYIKEQSGAYVDWQKQSDQYGVNAEKQATGGMTNTGFSESSQVSMYNTYQNRVMTAREVFNRAVLNYDNAIKDARLQNNSALAEIAYQALQTQLELGLEGFQYKNNLILELTNKKIEVDQMYHERYQDVLQQINTENAMAEEIRQFNLDYNLKVQQFEEEKRQWQADYDEKVRQFNEEIARLKAKDTQEAKLAAQELELKKQQLAEEKRQFDTEMAYKQQALAEEKRQFDAKQAANAVVAKTGGGAKNPTINKETVAVTQTKDSTPTNNMQSILALGYGPISAERLASLLASGQVKRTLKNGQYYYTRNMGGSNYNGLKNMGLSK